MNAQFSKSLVADYDSSSEDDEPPRENHITPLASALEMLDHNTGTNVSSSVFTNPYKNAETYEQSILEQHVKMTTIKEPEAKKKICYKFLRGKCRLGDKCHFLHQNPNVVDNSDKLSDSEEAESATKKEKSKKRCGLKDDLIPPKKYLKTFNKCK